MPTAVFARLRTDAVDRIIQGYSDVARHMRTYGNQLARQYGVTFTQLTILARLEGESELSQNELAAMTELAPVTVARRSTQPVTKHRGEGGDQTS